MSSRILRLQEISFSPDSQGNRPDVFTVYFNDADDEFPAQSSVLFQRRAEKYLDPECLAIAGRLLFTYMKKAQV